MAWAYAANVGSPYNEPGYRAARALLAGRTCHLCGRPGSDSADHVPALGEHRHLAGSGCCRLEAAHLSCNVRAGGWRLANRRRRAARSGVEVRPAPTPSRVW